MLYAIDPAGNKIEPTPGAVGECSLCRLPLIPKCGRINIWHWSHRAGDCDPWNEGETDWHRTWKGTADRSWCEVVMPPHRADIRRPDGLVIELQYSSISGHDIRAREAFYGNMWWLFHYGRFGKRVRFLFKEDRTIRLRWLGGRRLLSLITKPIFCDLGGPVVEFDGRLDQAGGHGRLLSRSEFLAKAGLREPTLGNLTRHSHYEVRWPKHVPGETIGTIVPSRDDLPWWFSMSAERDVREVFTDGSWRVVDRSEVLNTT
jgi:hypothetical protein